MTAYQGGKKRLGKHIYEAILEFENKYSSEKLDYFEPFCGMCGVTVHFAKNNDRKIEVCDLNADIIEMWKSLKNGWIPSKHCSKEYYNELKNSNVSSAERGFYGVVCSFGGQFFKGCYRTKTKRQNFIEAGIRGVTKAVEIMKNTYFLDANNYCNFTPSNKLIYCDPPYKGNTISSKLFQNFDHDKFWNTMREWSKNNIVVVSEKEAPDDFTSIWCREYNVAYSHKKKQQSKTKIKKYMEHLFVHSN